MANNYHLLFFPEPVPLPKVPGNQFPPKTPHYPSHDRQRERLAPLFETLCRSFEAQRATMQSTPTGVDPEQVLLVVLKAFLQQLRILMAWSGWVRLN